MVQPDRYTLKYYAKNMQFGCRITKARIQINTLIILKICRFSKATMVKGKPLNV